MIKLIVAIMTCASLSACWQRTDNFDLHRAVTFCKSLDNVANIVIFADFCILIALFLCSFLSEFQNVCQLIK